MSDIINEQTEDEFWGLRYRASRWRRRHSWGSWGLHGICLVYSSGMPWLVQIAGRVLVAT